jgi:hypothetical protein
MDRLGRAERGRRAMGDTLMTSSIIERHMVRGTLKHYCTLVATSRFDDINHPLLVV